MIYKKITSPIGNIILSSDGENITGLHIKGARYFTNIPPAWILDNHNLLLQNAELQLAEYFDGERKTFDLPLLFNGTPFQMKIWNQLVHIPYGKTISYKELAKKISVPNALRAVGSAVGRNPICIIIACHRVLASNGTLGGYVAGITCKETLLSLERTSGVILEKRIPTVANASVS